MKTVTYNSSSNTFATGEKIHATVESIENAVVDRIKKNVTKGKVKFFLGMVYFLTLVYSLFILLT